MYYSVISYIVPFYYLLRVGGILLLAIAVLVVYPYQTPAEGEYLSESNEYGVVYLAQWWAAETRDEQDASEDA